MREGDLVPPPTRTDKYSGVRGAQGGPGNNTTHPLHRWELLGNYRDFIKVMVFYLFCWRTKRIIVTAITCFKIYILIQSLMLFISENNRVFFSEITMAHTYIYILIKIIICNGNLFSWSRFYSANIRYFWINLLHQISLPESFLSSNITTWQIHMVTNPQSTISFSNANYQNLKTLRYSPQ